MTKKKLKITLVSIFIVTMTVLALRTQSVKLMISDAVWKLAVVLGPIMAWLGANYTGISALCAIIGVLFTVFFQYKEDKRRQKELEDRLTELKNNS